MEKLTIDNIPTIEEENPEKAIVVGYKDNIKEILSRKQKKQLRKQKKKAKKPRSKKIKKGNREKLGDGEKTNTHHVINRVNGGSNNINNLVAMNVKKHEALHKLFDNMPPHLILEWVLDYMYQVLEPNHKDMIVDEIKGIVDYYLKYNEFYNPKCLK